jgi:hypothetical protein
MDSENSDIRIQVSGRRTRRDIKLTDKLRNICFIRGLYSDRIQAVVPSRNNENFDDIAETAVEEENVIVSKHERYKGGAGTPARPGAC